MLVLGWQVYAEGKKEDFFLVFTKGKKRKSVSFYWMQVGVRAKLTSVRFLFSFSMNLSLIFLYWVGPVPYLELFWVGPVKKITLYDAYCYCIFFYSTLHKQLLALKWFENKANKNQFVVELGKGSKTPVTKNVRDGGTPPPPPPITESGRPKS